jgi:hypothetical protein
MGSAATSQSRRDASGPRKFAGARAWAANADPLFWLVVVGLVPAALVAWQMDPERPAWALRSAAVHRVEVGLAVYLGYYLVALALANAYRGHSLGRFALPGGGEAQLKDPALQEASEGAAEFEAETRGGLRDLADAVALMNGRVSALEDRRLGERLTRLEDGRIQDRLAALEQTLPR